MVEAYRNRGLAYNGEQEWKKAVVDFNWVLAKMPNDVESLIGRGVADTHFGGLFNTIKDEPEVSPLDDFAAALKLDPKSARAYIERGKFAQAGFSIPEHNKKALLDYEKAIEVDPTYAEGWYRRGATRERLYKDFPDDALAKKDYDRAIELEPRAEYFAARAKILEKQPVDDFDAILSDYSAAIKLDPFNPERYTERAVAQARKPAPDKAQILADYSQAVKLFQGKLDVLEMLAAYGGEMDSMNRAANDLSKALEMRGEVQLRSGNIREALLDFNAALEKDHANYDAIAGRGEILVGADRPEMAIQEISAQMPGLRGGDFEILAKKMLAARAQAFLALERYDEALIDLNQAIKLDSAFGYFSDNAEWYFLRALVWQNKGDNTRALADLNVAAKLDSSIIEKVKGTKFEKDLKPTAADAGVLIENGDTALLHKLMGNEWSSAGSPAKAGLEFDKAIALDPNYADAYNNRGLAWMALGNLDSASRDMDKAIALKGDDARFYVNRSVLRLHQQRMDDAVADAKKATELDPKNVEMWSTLATAQQMSNAYADAETSLNSALKLIAAKNETAGVRAKIALVRALQNKAPTKDEQYNLFEYINKDEVEFLLRATDAEIQRHPETSALKDLRAAIVAHKEKPKVLFVP